MYSFPGGKKVKMGTVPSDLAPFDSAKPHLAMGPRNASNLKSIDYNAKFFNPQATTEKPDTKKWDKSFKKLVQPKFTKETVKKESKFDGKKFNFTIEDVNATTAKDKKREVKARDKVTEKIRQDIAEKHAAKAHENFLKAHKKDYADEGAMSAQEDGVSQGTAKKRRGRKRERDDKYFDKAVNKIAEIKELLRNAKKTGMPVKERQRLRNQISAQQSRIRKKEETIFLNRVCREKDEKFLQLINLMANNLDGPQLMKVYNEVAGMWDLPSVESFRSRGLRTPSPPPVMAKASSKKSRTENDVGGLNVMKRVSSMKDEGPTTENDVLKRVSKTLLESFITKQEEYDQFMQNDEKIYTDDDY